MWLAFTFYLTAIYTVILGFAPKVGVVQRIWLNQVRKPEREEGMLSEKWKFILTMLLAIAIGLFGALLIFILT